TVEWQLIEQERHGFSVSFLVFSEHFLASECLLLRERMREATELLSSQQLLACAPRRGVLLVCPYHDQIGVAEKTFIDVCMENYVDGENEQISPLIWIVENGEVVNVIDLGPPPQAITPSKPATDAGARF